MPHSPDVPGYLLSTVGASMCPYTLSAKGVWCPLFWHSIGITERNTGVCRFCAAEGLQEAPA